jgi:predicted nucleic acid-binding protein
MIVSNATPLIAFARIGELTLLEGIVHQITLGETVWAEVTAVTTHPGAEAIGQATWITVRAVTLVPTDLLALLDRGEAEVIALAEELRAQEVLLDERAARAIAITRGLPVIGTAGPWCEPKIVGSFQL